MTTITPPKQNVNKTIGIYAIAGIDKNWKICKDFILKQKKHGFNHVYALYM